MVPVGWGSSRAVEEDGAGEEKCGKVARGSTAAASHGRQGVEHGVVCSRLAGRFPKQSLVHKPATQTAKQSSDLLWCMMIGW